MKEWMKKSRSTYNILMLLPAYVEKGNSIMKENMCDKLKELIVSIAPQVSKVDIVDETNLIDDLLFDSLMVMELVVSIEEEFGVEIDDSTDYEKVIVFKTLFEQVVKSHEKN